jgi:DNA-binding transcriptional LysR family regulator
MFQAGLEAARDLGEQPSGHLRINTTRASVPLLINRLLPDFHNAYPDIRLELIGEDELVDIVQQGFDAGIRLGHIVEADMVSTWLTPPEKYVVVGAPHFLDTHGRPRQPKDVQDLPVVLIRRNGQLSRTWEFTSAGQNMRVGVDGPLIVGDSESCIRAALSGRRSPVHSRLACHGLCRARKP